MPMMKCGHASQGSDSAGKPVCVVCVGIHPGAREIVPEPNLEGRTARCGNHGDVASSTGLAFFSHNPDREFDSYYCGHGGWD